MTPRADDAPRPAGRFGGLGPLASRMALVQKSQLHVSGAYRERADTVVSRIRF